MLSSRVRKFIYIFLLLILSFILFENSKGAEAIKYEEIDTSKDYMICTLATATESSFNVLYDSQHREIRNVNFKNLYEQLYKFNGNFSNDLHGSLNTFVIYGKFDYDEETGDILIHDFDVKFIYPVKRDMYCKDRDNMPKDYIYHYESSWIIALLRELLKSI